MVKDRYTGWAGRIGGSLALAAVLLAGCARPPEVPGVEGWTGEPQVATRIEAAREDVLADPGSASAWGRLGMIFQAHELHTEAVVCYRRAAELAASEPRWPYLAALSLRKTDLEAAAESFAEAARRGMDHPAFHVNHGDVLTRLDQPERAAAEYRKALEADGRNTHARYGLAQLALAAGEPETAREQLEQAAAIAPWHGEARTLLARTYQRLGRVEDAERELKAAGAYPDATQTPDPVFQAVEAEAVTAVAYARRGRQLARAGRYAEAEELYRRVLEIRPGTAGDHSNLGGALAGQGKVDEALEHYRKALELDDDDPYALNNLAMALAARGDPERAVEMLEKAVEVEPAYPEAHHNLGLIRAGQKRHDDAIGHYRDALVHNPSYSRAHTDLGTALAATGDVDGAIEHWRAALEIDSRELSALYNLSLALSRRGDHAEAIAWLRRGLEIAPDSSRLVSLLAWELATAPEAELRDGEEAVRLARRVYDAFPGQPGLGNVLAAALAEAGRYENAVAIGEKALEQARAAGQRALVLELAARIDAYRREQPFLRTSRDGG